MPLELRKLTHRYGKLTALSDVSASATPGRITAVLGPNASGKSTLLRCIIGATRPTAGEALLDGKPVHGMSAYHTAQKLAYVPQRSTVAAAFTVREVVELGRYALPTDHRRVSDALERMELIDLVDRAYAALSVGQQQRVTLARALAQLPQEDRPAYLVLDEPMSAMDLRHMRDAMTLLRQLAGRGVTVLIAMHDLSLAAATADEAWLLQEGRLVASGNICDVLSIDRIATVYGVDFEWVAGRLVAC